MAGWAYREGERDEEGAPPAAEHNDHRERDRDRDRDRDRSMSRSPPPYEGSRRSSYRPRERSRERYRSSSRDPPGGGYRVWREDVDMLTQRPRSRSPGRYRRRSYTPERGERGSSRGRYRSRSPGRGYHRGHDRRGDYGSARESLVQSARDASQQDRRVYVGNLPYDTNHRQLKDFMSDCMFP